MKQEILNEMVQKAKTKKSGVYALKGNSYLVFDGHVHSYCDYFGNLYELCYGFNVGKGKARDRFEAKDILKDYLRQLTSPNTP